MKSDIYSVGILIIEMLTGEKGCPDVGNVRKSPLNVKYKSPFKATMYCVYMRRQKKNSIKAFSQASWGRLNV
jgi:serine/threonine protein kinase